MYRRNVQATKRSEPKIMNNLNAKINTLMAQCIRSNSTNSHIDQFANNENCLPKTHSAADGGGHEAWRGTQSQRLTHLRVGICQRSTARQNEMLNCLPRENLPGQVEWFPYGFVLCAHSFYTLLEIGINCRSIRRQQFISNWNCSNYACSS